MNTPNSPSPPHEALLRNVLERVARHELTVDEALPQIRHLAGPASAAATIQTFTGMLQPALQRQTAAAGWIVGLIFALIGSIFFAVGAGFGWRSVRFMDAPQAPGIIVSAGKAPTAKYVVQGKEYRVTATISKSPPPYNLGDKCTVLYQTHDPTDAQLDYFSERWLFPVIFGGIGAVLGSIGWGILLTKLLGRLFRARTIRMNEAERFTIE